MASCLFWGGGCAASWHLTRHDIHGAQTEGGEARSLSRSLTSEMLSSKFCTDPPRVVTLPPSYWAQCVKPAYLVFRSESRLNCGHPHLALPHPGCWSWSNTTTLPILSLHGPHFCYLGIDHCLLLGGFGVSVTQSPLPWLGFLYWLPSTQT